MVSFMETPQWGAGGSVFRDAADPIHNDQFLFCSRWAPGFMPRFLGALGFSTYFSMPAYAAGL